MPSTILKLFVSFCRLRPPVGDGNGQTTKEDGEEGMHRLQDYLLTMLRAAMPKAEKRPVSDVASDRTTSSKRPVTAAADGRCGIQEDCPLFHTDIVAEIIEFCPTNNFLFIAGVSKIWRSAWTAAGRATTTSVRLAATTHSRTVLALGEPDFMRASANAGGLFCLTAEAGNLEGLQEAARAFGREWIYDTSSMEVTKRAAEGGHLDVLEWATDQGCPSSTTTCNVAAKRGHMHVLEWARSRGGQLDETTCSSAAEGGQLDVLKWVRSRGCPWDRFTCSSAAKGGHHRLLQWARSQGCPWDASTCSAAAGSGHLEVLKWARKNGCPWDSTTCSAAAEGGHLDVLKWARSQECPWNAFTCGHAAMWGHLDMLKWAWSHGCPWSPSACSWAAGRGHLDVLKWANEQGCPWNKSFCAGCARSKGHQEVVDWIREQQQQEEEED